ncbi:MAG: TIGR00341 family protein [Myxococcales bacterium]|nr:TIGR00341 family protein [Myxococcales bacterium]
MALRFVDIHPGATGSIPEIDAERVDVIGSWKLGVAERAWMRVLVRLQDTEALVELLQDHLDTEGGARIVLSSVEATWPDPDRAVLPEPSELEVTEEDDLGAPEPPKPPSWWFERIPREELQQRMDADCRITLVYLVLSAVAAVIAAGGLLRDNVAVVIGAMVVAPLMGPNLAFALNAVLGDLRDMMRAAFVAAVGGALVFVVALAIGWGMEVELTEEIMSRTTVHPIDVGVAFAAGIAGAFSVTRGVSTGLVGVMVAAALVPPLVVSGLLFGAGMQEEALAAASLMAVNVVAIHLTALTTFWLMGLRPRDWLESRRAVWTTSVSVTVWLLLLAGLVALLLRRAVL